MSDKLCIFPQCVEWPYSRGLCKSHYHVARTLVRKGKTDWKTLVENGKAKDGKFSGRPITGAREWFLESVPNYEI